MQNFFWRENLKFLRNRKQISQDQLASVLKMTRVKLNSHENNHSKNALMEDIVGYADYFGFVVDTFLRVNLAKLSELKLRELEAGNDVFLTGKNIRILATTVDKENNENVEFVPLKAKAGYLSGFSDPEFIERLPKFSIPNLPKGRTYRMFPIKGDSMLPIPDGSIVIGSYVEDILSVKKDTPCIVVVKGQDIAFKMVDITEARSTGKVLLKSLNVRYKPYEADIVDILEIWSFAGYISSGLPEQIGNAEIVSALMELRGDMQKLLLK